MGVVLGQPPARSVATTLIRSGDANRKRNVTEPGRVQPMKMVSVPGGGISVGPVTPGVMLTSWRRSRTAYQDMRRLEELFRNSVTSREVVCGFLVDVRGVVT